MRQVLVIAALALTACGQPQPPEIKFAPYGAGFATKPDFARVEHEFPLVPADLAKLTPDNLKAFDQEQIDQIYARLTAGPIPDGPYNGGLFFPKGASGENASPRSSAALRALHRLQDARSWRPSAKPLWKGKVFYRNERVLRNRIEDLALLKPLIDGDPASIAKIDVDGKDAWLLFPAKLFCGQSLLDSRRESIIIDYAFTDEIQGYRENPDYLAGRRGLKVRDEIRMVRPGLYLGRAYLGKVFLLNFTLENRQVAEREGPAFVQTGQSREDCWPGTQQRQLVTASK